MRGLGATVVDAVVGATGVKVVVVVVLLGATGEVVVGLRRTKIKKKLDT